MHFFCREQLKIVLFIILTCLLNLDLFCQHNYFGAWRTGTGTQYVRTVNSLNDWISWDDYYVNTLDLRLVDFEKYEVDGQAKFTGVWQEGTGIQYVRIVSTLSEWSTWDNHYVNNEGLRLTDFEKYEDNGQDYYFGVWRTGTGAQYVRVENTLNDLFTWDGTYFNQGLRLIDFEKYEVNGQDKYLGAWRTGTGTQYGRVLNSLTDWSTWDNHYVNNEGLRLIDFEKYEENGQDKYLGFWRAGTGTQYWRLESSLTNWGNWDNSYFGQGLRVQDFEYYPDPVTASPACTHTNTIPTNGIAIPEMSNCDDLVKCFMEDYDIPGATFALAKDGKLAYMRSFGYANQTETEETQPNHLFRIASISKPITSIAIMKMVENGQLSLTQKAFGPNGILEDSYFLNAISDARIYDITVQQLLEHSAGWDRDIDCTPDPASPYNRSFNSCDPLAFPLHVTQQLGESNPMSESATIKFLLQKGLNFSPGTKYAYSNVGYLVLGEIIEKISGMEYENYVKSTILEPIGICDMHIGKNLLANKKEREGEYISTGTTLSSYGTGSYVPWQYGGWNLEAMDAHGGWIATARDLVKLLVSVDGLTAKPDILSAASIATMTTPSVNASYYAKGWSVNTAGTWWHTGALDGTASFFLKTYHGYSIAIILNKRSSGQFWSDFDNLPWECLANTATYPSHDLLLFPNQSASNMIFSNISQAQMNLSWNRGDGTKRLIVAKAGAPVDNFPLDGVNYTASSSFASGSNLGNGNFVVYNNTGNNVTLTNLSANTNYHFRIFEYTQNNSTGNYALYRLCDSPSYSQTATTSTSNCQNSLNITTTISTSGNYKASNTITASNTVNAGTTVEYAAGQSITLTPNFYVKAGSNFHAYIQNCTPLHTPAPISTASRVNIEDEIISNPLKMQVSPNPFTNHMNLTYELDQNQEIEINVMAMDGRIIEKIAKRMEQKGLHTISFETSNLKNGTYFVYLISKDKIITEKIIKLSL